MAQKLRIRSLPENISQNTTRARLEIPDDVSVVIVWEPIL